MYYGQKGDFYGGGGYYRGDPGLFSFLGKAAKAAVGFIPGVGPFLQKAVSIGSQLSSLRKVATRAGGAAVATVIKHPVLSAAGAAGVVGAAAGTMGGRMSASPRTLPGQRGGMGYAGGMGRRHRRMHVTNPKALRRAIRRAAGFEKLARRVMGFTSPHKPKGRAYFKRKVSRRR